MATTSKTERKALNVSFELFPPRDAAGERRLIDCVSRLNALSPVFFSLTYGAGGTDSSRTIASLLRLRNELGILPAAHLTCGGESRADVDRVVDKYAALGVRHIVALRGDAASENGVVADEYTSTAAFVGALKRRGVFEVSVAAYPERHPKGAGWQADLDALVAKFDAGADRAITQFFFNTSDFLRLRDRLAARGITKPLIPGLLPVNEFTQTRRFARRCGAGVPTWLRYAFETAGDDAELNRIVAVSVAVDQIDELRREGVSDIHMYTLNRPDLCIDICRLAGVGTARPVVAVPTERKAAIG